jgi:hypothetical protein
VDDGQKRALWRELGSQLGPSQRPVVLLGLLAAVILIAMGVAYASQRDATAVRDAAFAAMPTVAPPLAPAIPPHSPRARAEMVLAVAEVRVRDRLKAASTAAFGHPGERQDPSSCVTQFDDDRFEVRGWVDAQNQFGAMLRANFLVKMHCPQDYECALDEPIALTER